MSYASRTKLSCDSSACTVLNDDYVFVMSGLGAGQRMPLADWRIIIGGETVREDYLPLPAAEPEPAAMAQPYAPPTAASAAADPVGTKLVWSATTQPFQNYCVAIQTKHGVLQVKKVSSRDGYAVELARQMFPTYEAWLATLPSEGKLIKTLPNDILSALDARKKYSAEKMADGGTAEAIGEIQVNWKVWTQIKRLHSTNQLIQYSGEEIGRLRAQIQDITLEQDITNPSYRSSRTSRLLRILSTLADAKRLAATQTPEQNEYRRAFMNDHYKQRLYVHTSEGKLQIAYDLVTQTIAVRIPTGPREWMYRLEFVKSLLDLPFSIGTELHLSVRWRGKEIDLYASDRN